MDELWSDLQAAHNRNIQTNKQKQVNMRRWTKTTPNRRKRHNVVSHAEKRRFGPQGHRTKHPENLIHSGVPASTSCVTLNKLTVFDVLDSLVGSQSSYQFDPNSVCFSVRSAVNEEHVRQLHQPRHVSLAPRPRLRSSYVYRTEPTNADMRGSIGTRQTK